MNVSSRSLKIEKVGCNDDTVEWLLMKIPFTLLNDCELFRTVANLLLFLEFFSKLQTKFSAIHNTLLSIHPMTRTEAANVSPLYARVAHGR